MADIEIHRFHDLGRKAARAAADLMADHLGRKFDLKGSWTGDVLHFKRPGVTGTLEITDQDLRLTVALGFLLKAMRGSIENAVVQELDTLFARGLKASAASAPSKAAGEKARSKTGSAHRKKGG